MQGDYIPGNIQEVREVTIITWIKMMKKEECCEYDVNGALLLVLLLQWITLRSDTSHMT